MPLGILLGLAAALCWGIGDFCARGSARFGGTFLTLIAIQVVAIAAFVALALPLGLVRLTAVPLGPGLAAAGISLAIMGGAACLYRAFAIGNIALASPIAASFGALSALLALLSGERPSAAQLTGIVVTLGGVVLTSAVSSVPSSPAAQTPPLLASDPAEAVSTLSAHGARTVTVSTLEPAAPLRGRSRLEPGLVEALAAMLIFGVAYWALHFVVGVLGGVEVAFIAKVADLLVLAAIALAGGLLYRGPRRRGHAPSPAGAAPRPWYAPRRPPAVFWLFVVPTALFDTSANVAYNIGITHGLVAVVVVLSSLFSAVTVLLAWLFLRERLRALQWLGVVVILAGITLVSV